MIDNLRFRSFRRKLMSWREDDIRKRIKQLLADGSKPDAPYIRDCTWLLQQWVRERYWTRRYCMLSLVLVVVLCTLAWIER